jgi:hypothetical protein
MSGDAKDKLDRMLDAALAEYANVEPPTGMERRILARVRESGAGRRMVWWRWAAAIPALACVIAVLVYREQPAIEPPRLALSVPPAPVLARPVAKPVLRPRPVPLPKLEVFPTPSPLSAEERALAMLVAQFPEKAVELLTPVEPKPIEPIKIEPLSDGG